MSNSYFTFQQSLPLTPGTSDLEEGTILPRPLGSEVGKAMFGCLRSDPKSLNTPSPNLRYCCCQQPQVLVSQICCLMH